MTIEKISIMYPFSIGSFLNMKIGLEASLSEGDNIEECYNELSRKAKQLAAFESRAETIQPIMKTTHWQSPTSTVTDITHSEPEQKPLLQLIQESKTIPELRGWQLLIQVEKDETKKRELLMAYDKMYEKLTA
jgi:hypothetical protein